MEFEIGVVTFVVITALWVTVSVPVGDVGDNVEVLCTCVVGIFEGPLVVGVAGQAGQAGHF